MIPVTTRRSLIDIAADMFDSERRRGWLANKCSWVLGAQAHANMNEQEYIKQFIEQCKDRDIDDLEEMADAARPSNMPTAYERERAARHKPESRLRLVSACELDETEEPKNEQSAR
jgi:hypothetical protein